MQDDELERLRRERLARVQADQAASRDANEAAEQRRAQEQAQREAVLRAILTPEARERLSRVRIARPDQAEALEEQLIALARAGRLAHKVGDEDLRLILQKLFPPKREINIRRKGAIEE
jgi:programmed cell death protein 5